MISTALERLVWGASHELLLFAAVGILLIGVDDLCFDILWLWTRIKGRAARGGRLPPVGSPQIIERGGEGVDGPLAIFLPAWDEHEVLPETLAHMLSAWEGEDFRIYLGCYPNDERTIMSVSHLVSTDQRVRLVVADRNGPTTKGHNLNQMWGALGMDERAMGRRYAAIVLHDAEQVVSVVRLIKSNFCAFYQLLLCLAFDHKKLTSSLISIGCCVRMGLILRRAMHVVTRLSP